MKFVIKYAGDSNPDVSGLKEILKAHGAHSIESAQQAKLTIIEVEESAFSALEANLPKGFEIYREQHYQVPNTKKSIRNHSQ